jgi:RNA polymerase sigma factor (sigma-70 family)
MTETPRNPGNGPPAGTEAAATDGQLLECFLARRDEAAFAELVRRHGPLVLHVCRRILGDAHHAEDAFQATFLVLACKAGAIRKHGSVGSWLYGVARRVALQARQLAYRGRERSAVDVEPGELAEREAMNPDPAAELSRCEIEAALDAELERLPEKYRAPLVLCFLQDKSHGDAAGELAWAVGTLKSRLARGRELLRQGLARRGVAVSAGVLGALLTESTAPAAVPATLLTTTAKAAVAFSAGSVVVAGAVSTGAALLARTALKGLAAGKLQLAALGVLTATLLGGGALACRAAPAERRAVTAPAPRAGRVPSCLVCHTGAAPWTREGQAFVVAYAYTRVFAWDVDGLIRDACLRRCEARPPKDTHFWRWS